MLSPAVFQHDFELISNVNNGSTINSSIPRNIFAGELVSVHLHLPNPLRPNTCAARLHPP